MLARCDYRSITCVLHCMPNLRQFYFKLLQSAAWPFPAELVDVDVAQQMLQIYVSGLYKFEFPMSIAKKYPKLV